MAKVHGRLTAVYYNGRDFSPYFNNADATHQVDSVESTGFGSQDKDFIPGLRSGQIKFQGHWDDTAGAGGVETLLIAGEQSATDPIVTVALGGTAIDKKGWAGYGDQVLNIQHTAPVAGIIGLNADFVANGGLLHIRTLLGGTLTPAAAGGTTAAWNGGTATAQGAVGIMQALSVPAGTPVVLVEHSADGATGWATLLTFAGETGATAPRAQRVTAGGAVNPFLRTTVTGGTIVAHVSVSQPPI